MIRRSAPAPLLLAVLLGLAGPAAGQAVARRAAADPAAAVDVIFAPFTGTDTPGCAVGVGRDGVPLLTRAYGMADLEHGVRNTPETVFETGSVSKQFTAAATLLLALEGRLSLDDDVRRWIPEVPDYGEPITIRHLLNHTSGLRDWGSVAALGGWPRTTRVHTHEHVLDIVSRQRALNYRPGEAYSYTNTGYNLQAVLVERVSGMPFAEFTRTRLFEPLGLTRTQWRDDFRRVVPDRAIAYEPVDDGFRLDMPFENVHGNGGLMTTVGELLEWTWNLQTGAVGGPGLLAEMHRRGVLNDGRTITYASGLRVDEYRGVPEVSHSGSTAGYRAYAARYPDHGLAVAVICNAAHAGATALAHRVADLWLGDALAVEPAARDDEPDRGEPAPWAPTAAQLGDYAGRYRSDEAEATWEVRVDGGRLLLQPRFGEPDPLAPLEPDLFRDGGRRIRFVRDADGAVTELAVHESRVWDLRFQRLP